MTHLPKCPSLHCYCVESLVHWLCPFCESMLCRITASVYSPSLDGHLTARAECQIIEHKQRRGSGDLYFVFLRKVTNEINEYNNARPWTLHLKITISQRIRAVWGAFNRCSEYHGLSNSVFHNVVQHCLKIPHVDFAVLTVGMLEEIHLGTWRL